MASDKRDLGLCVFVFVVLFFAAHKRITSWKVSAFEARKHSFFSVIVDKDNAVWFPKYHYMSQCRSEKI